MNKNITFQQALDIIDDIKNSGSEKWLSSWELDFLNSIEIWALQKKDLTEKQTEVLDKIFHKIAR